MKEKAYIIYNTEEYAAWLEGQTAKSQVQVLGRISHIQDEGFFGDHKALGDDVFELRWKNGRRVYYADIPERKILLLFSTLYNFLTNILERSKLQRNEFHRKGEKHPSEEIHLAAGSFSQKMSQKIVQCRV